VPATLFFDLDKTLCHPQIPFAEIFSKACAPLLESTPTSASDDTPGRLSALVHAWAEALELPGHSTTAGCLARALAAAGIPASEWMVTRCAATLVAAWAATQRLDAGVAETLEMLVHRHPLGIITNGPSDSQHAVIHALHLDRVARWQLVSGDRTIGIRKPSPYIFEHALAISGSKPQDTWFIGDSPENDITGALAAGLHACWLHAPGEAFPDEIPAPAAQIVSISELPLMLRREERA
jgi:HAD superfamily hydrolase (TIGR01549 family)